MTPPADPDMRPGSRGPEALVRLGRIGAPHGLDGLVTFRADNPESKTIRPGVRLVVSGPAGRASQVVVGSVHRLPKTTLLAFEGVTGRTGAESLRGATLSVRRADLPPLGDGEFYHADVVGLPVKLGDGTDAGRVASIFHAATDVIVVHGPLGEFMVPVVEGFIIRLGPGEVVVDGDALDLQSGG